MTPKKRINSAKFRANPPFSLPFAAVSKRIPVPEDLVLITLLNLRSNESCWSQLLPFLLDRIMCTTLELRYSKFLLLVSWLKPTHIVGNVIAKPIQKERCDKHPATDCFWSVLKMSENLFLGRTLTYGQIRGPVQSAYISLLSVFNTAWYCSLSCFHSWWLMPCSEVLFFSVVQMPLCPSVEVPFFIAFTIKHWLHIFQRHRWLRSQLYSVKFFRSEYVSSIFSHLRSSLKGYSAFVFFSSLYQVQYRIQLAFPWHASSVNCSRWSLRHCNYVPLHDGRTEKVIWKPASA